MSKSITQYKGADNAILWKNKKQQYISFIPIIILKIVALNVIIVFLIKNYRINT